MSIAPSKLSHPPLARVRSLGHVALLLILSACSGSAVSLGSGIDDTEAALTDDPSASNMNPSGTPVDCAINPLSSGCPVAEEDFCGRAVGDCYADVLTNGEDPSRCQMLSAACPATGSSEPTEMAVHCGQMVNDCYAEAMANRDDPARCEMVRASCPTAGSAEPAEVPVDCALQFNDCLAQSMAAGESAARCEMQLVGCRSASADPRM